MNRWVELLLGLMLLLGLIVFSWASDTYSWIIFGKDINMLHAAWIFLKGGVFWAIASAGLLLIILGINDLRE